MTKIAIFEGFTLLHPLDGNITDTKYRMCWNGDCHHQLANMTFEVSSDIFDINPTNGQALFHYEISIYFIYLYHFYNRVRFRFIIFSFC